MLPSREENCHPQNFPGNPGPIETWGFHSSYGEQGHRADLRSLLSSCPQPMAKGGDDALEASQRNFRTSPYSGMTSGECQRLSPCHRFSACDKARVTTMLRLRNSDCFKWFIPQVSEGTPRPQRLCPEQRYPSVPKSRAIVSPQGYVFSLRVCVAVHVAPRLGGIPSRAPATAHACATMRLRLPFNLRFLLSRVKIPWQGCVRLSPEPCAYRSWRSRFGEGGAGAEAVRVLCGRTACTAQANVRSKTETDNERGRQARGAVSPSRRDQNGFLLHKWVISQAHHMHGGTLVFKAL